MLKQHPADEAIVDDKGQSKPFWSGKKLAPAVIAFDPSDDMHFLFVMACVLLMML